MDILETAQQLQQLAQASKEPFTFRDLVEVFAGMTVVGTFIAGSIRVGRMIERQEHTDRRSEEMHTSQVAMLARLEAKIDTRDMQQQERIQLWTQRGAEWDSHVMRHGELLVQHEQAIASVRNGIHKLHDSTNQMLTEHEIKLSRLDARMA